MTAVERKAGDFVIDAALLVDAFDLPQDEIKARMRNGAITSRCEKGVDEDTGRWRLTFQHNGRACRFTVDDAGTVLKRTTFPVETGPQKPTERQGPPHAALSGKGTT